MRCLLGVLACMLLPPLAAWQAGPQADASELNSRPVAPPISAERLLQLRRLPYGVVIAVTTTDGSSLECVFTGATDSALFCGDPDHIAETGYQFDRTRVLRAALVHARAAHVHHEFHFHGRFIADGLVGTIVGVGAGSHGGVKAGALAGLAGALVTETVAEGVQQGSWPAMPPL